MARPQKRIDAQQVVKLAQLGATHAEMADFFGCDRATVERRFAAEIAKGRAEMRLKLRRLQLRAAERGSAAMLIFLGKTLLGQIQRDEEAPIAVFYTVVQPNRPCPHCKGTKEDPKGGKCLLCKGTGQVGTRKDEGSEPPSPQPQPNIEKPQAEASEPPPPQPLNIDIPKSEASQPPPPPPPPNR